MDIKVRKKQISEIRYYNSIKETLYPADQMEENLEYLKGFMWQDDIRPLREEF